MAIAEQLPIEVVSADSRQIRRGMRIGSAAPSDEERAAVPHHLVGIIEPDAPWTLADFLERAHAALEAIWARDRLPLLLGGSGQYVWALLEGWQPPAVPPDIALRARLNTEVAEHGAAGAEALHARLAALDPASAERIDPRNTRRVVRAIEIIEATGAPIAPLPRVPPRWPWQAVGLQWPREQLYRRADERAEQIYAGGLVEETRALIGRHGAGFDALRSIGYAEATRVVSGEWDETTALERTKLATHRLIRQQGNWFRADDDRIAWHDGADVEAVTAAVEAAARTLVR